MKRLLSVLFLFISIYSSAQVMGTYKVATISAMKTYFGTAEVVYVTATNELFSSCPLCTADESVVYAGAGGRKWLRVTVPIGTSSQYLRGDKTLATFPTVNDASLLTTGSLPDARLSSNVNLLNTAQTISAIKTVTATEMRIANASARLRFFDAANTTEIGYVGESGNGLVINSVAALKIRFINQVEGMNIYSDGRVGMQAGGTFTNNGIDWLQVGGSVKATQFTVTTTTTPAPTSGQAIFWFDGTNVKVTKNVSGTTTTSTIF